MRKTLFAREFRSALIPNLVTVGAILVTLVAVERFYGLRWGKVQDVRAFTDVALLVGLVVSGFISGERCFPAELKESRILFLSSLPISRTWTWLTIVSARLLAGLTSLSLAAAVRRPHLVLPDSRDAQAWPVIALVVFGYVFLFSVGTLFALLFLRTFVLYVTGFIILGILLSETLFASSYTARWPALTSLADVPAATLKEPLFLVFFLILFLLTALLLSLQFFIRGEVGDLGQRIRNQFAFGVTVAVYLSLVFCLASNAKIISIRDTWNFFGHRLFMELSSLRSEPGLPRWPFPPSPCGVSADGRYLFVLESSYERPFIARVSIVGTLAGRLTYRSVYGGVYGGYWSDEDNILNLLVLNNSPLDRWGYLVDGNLDWIRLSPDGREITRLRLKGLEDVAILRGGTLSAFRECGLSGVRLLDTNEKSKAWFSSLYLDEKGGRVWISEVLPSEIWRSSPRAKDLRIWPPQGGAQF